MKQKRATSQDVANLAGVSRTTVSLVLNRVEGANIPAETRQKVYAAAKALNYVPNATAQALATQRSNAIGLIMTRSPHHISSDAFLPQILGGLLEVIKKERFRLLIELVEEEHQEQVYSNLARAKHIDAMILLTPRLNDKGIERLEAVGVPTVLMGKTNASTLYTVDVDNFSAAKKATNRLLSLGHRKIACISNAPPSYGASLDRVLGYKNALLDAGITPDDALIRYADFDPQSGYEAMHSLLASRQEFSAVFVASDNVAMGAKSAIRETGLYIPDDISLIGFDDIPWASYSDPPLTTVHLPARDLASKACLLLLDLLKGKQVKNKNLTLETKLMIRQSCKAI
ncbi:MAG TPA: LacI family transcriptional regulator [Anaerolineales bacterium]|nr:LacI family transcriptional regulator [Anaerolineales bacterium]